jgi:site-specific DNA-methyltransferase (adenine-specific)
LGEGIVVDPFMGGGSTIAAAIYAGYESIGIEMDPKFFDTAREAIPLLAALPANGKASNGLGSRTSALSQGSLALMLEP